VQHGAKTVTGSKCASQLTERASRVTCLPLSPTPLGTADFSHRCFNQIPHFPAPIRGVGISGGRRCVGDPGRGDDAGADRLGEQWASKHGIPVKQFPAQWRKHGHSAGYKRNETMADNADALIALWDGKSRGTKHMIDIARRKGLPVYVLVND